MAELEAAREGDHITHGGFIVGGSSNVFVNSLASARATIDSALCLIDDLQLIAAGSSTVFINGYPAARRTDPIQCDALIDDGSNNVFIGG